MAIGENHYEPLSKRGPGSLELRTLEALCRENKDKRSEGQLAILDELAGMAAYIELSKVMFYYRDHSGHNGDFYLDDDERRLKRALADMAVKYAETEDVVQWLFIEFLRKLESDRSQPKYSRKIYGDIKRYLWN